MMDSQIRLQVLWIDDEWEKQKDLIGEAEHFDIDIIPAASHQEGMEILESESNNFHAVILDAKVKLNKESKKADLTGLRASRDRLIEINQTQYLPSFIFTGQPDYLDSAMFRESYGDFFVKGSDNKKLYQAIKVAASKSEEMKVKMEFPEAFKCFEKGILNSKSKGLFIEIVNNLRNSDYRKKNINVQRDFLESIYLALNDPFPCIPNFCFSNGRPNQEWCTIFMEDRLVKDRNGNSEKLNKDIPKDIKGAFRKIKESTNGYSHLSEEDLVKIPFIANAYSIMEILGWMPSFIEEHYKNYI
ncbi:hypothetical protein [Hyunsoonleella aestuarii]|uniref:Response regulator n=1 Tax=Hyunsoonleella aestuarii TaxID=912802 RepID=A0ABP8EDX8_9FLAO|nr:hypothetical protein [Hyunsoonleella aestuarii]